jgi:RHS repeat-associated protein
MGIWFRNIGILNLSGSTLDGTAVTLGPTEVSEFPTYCDLAKFLTESGANIAESEPGEVVDQINDQLEKTGCAFRVFGVPVNSTEGTGTPGIPSDGDNPDAQEAPNVQNDGVVDLDRSDPPNDLRDPTDVMHDRKNPASDGELYDNLKNRGASDGEARDGVERARRGDSQNGQKRATHSGERTNTRPSGGDPVDLFTGLLSLTSVDLDIPTPFIPIQFIRLYQSGRPYYGPWGFNWDHNWNVYLRELENGDIARWNGRMHEDLFHWDGASFEPPRGVFELLSLEPGPGLQYIIKARGGVQMVFERPDGWTDAEKIPLVKMTDRAGNKITLSYDSNNRLKGVLDNDGRGLHLSYGSYGLLEAVEDHVGRRIKYCYDDIAEHLVAVKFPATSDFPDGILTCYEYDISPTHIALRHNILRVIDHDKNTILLNEYGQDPSDVSFNRVIRQFQGGFCYRFGYDQIQYVPPDPLFVNLPAMQTSVSYPSCALWTHTFNYRGDLLDERYRLNQDRSFRVVISKREYDSQGNLSAQITPDGTRTEYTYDHANPDPRMRGNLLKVEMRPPATVPIMGRVVFQADYDPEFQLPRQVLTENGALTHFFYDFDVAPNPGNQGDLVRIEWPDATLPDGSIQQSVTTFETNSRGQVKAIVSPEGTRNKQVYEPGGSPKAGFLRELRADVGGVNELTCFDYDSFGYLAERIEPGGAIKRFRFNALGQLEEEILPAVDGIEDRILYNYNAQHRLAKVSEPRGTYDDTTITTNWIISTFQTNPIGHLVEAIIGANTAQPRKYTFCTDFEGRIITLTDPEGIVTRRCYDERGLILFETMAAGTPEEMTTRFVYDRTGHLTQFHQPGGRVTTLEYDPWGRLVRVTLSNGTLIRNTWGPFDLILTRIVEGEPGDGSLVRILSKSDFEYDERGRLVKETVESFATDPTLAIPLSTVKWYDRDGRCMKRVGVRGAVRSFEYDGLNRVNRTEDPLGNVQIITYGPDGFPQRVMFEDNTLSGTNTRFMEFEHDARGRLRRTIESSGGETMMKWDARDLLSERRNQVGVLTEWKHGLSGEVLLRTIDPTGLALSYQHSYDLLGRSISFRDPNGEVTSVQRDALGRITRVQLADGGVVSRLFNAAGDLERVTTPDGSEANFTYDPAGRLEVLSARPGPGRLPVPIHSFGYDGLDRVVSAKAGIDTVSRLFDSMGRLLKDSFNGRTFERIYDDLAGQYTLRYPDLREEVHSWDLLGRVNQIQLTNIGSSAVGTASGAPGTILLKTAYSGGIRVAKLSHANGITSEWHHDNEARLLRVNHTDATGISLESTRYRHDVNNRRRVLQLTGNPSENHIFDYDHRGRLVRWRKDFALPPLPDSDSQAAQDTDISAAETAAAAAPFFEEYVLDGSDTRLSVTRSDHGSSIVVPYIQTSGHKIIGVGSETLNYDADGRRLTDATRKISYDALGRIAQIHTADATTLLVSHDYDPLGRWSGGQIGTESLHKFYFGDMCLQEETPGNVVICQRTYHPLLLMPVIENRVGGPFHLHLDGHQSLVVVTDASGNPVERYRYDAFGLPRIFDGAGSSELAKSALGTKPWFAGMPYLEHVGLYFTPERHYDPVTGLFLARDPFMHWLSPSPYVYVIHDPVNLLDPTGDILPLLVAGLVVGAIGAVIGGVGRAITDPNADGWDIFASAAFGFGAGFIGGVTFGAASTAIGGALFTHTALSAGTASFLGSVGGGMAAGGAAGVFSGFSTGLYEGYRHGGDPWEMAVIGAYEEGISGVAAGAIGGGLFHGSLRLGTIPRGSWAALRGASTTASRSSVLPSVIGRGMVSPYGLGAIGVGYGSGVAGGTVRNWLRGEDFDDAFFDAQTDGLTGAATAPLMWIHPISGRYWNVRLRPNVAQRIQGRRPRGVHHQYNQAQFPEFATPTPRQRGVSRWTTRWDRFMNRLTEGNVTGPFSEYNGQNPRFTHQQLHEMWRQPGQGGNWTNIPTHGPWTPPWIVNYLAPDQRSENQRDKES